MGAERFEDLEDAGRTVGPLLKVSTEYVRSTHQFNIQNVNFRPTKDSLSSPLHLVG